jgi:hypothetical protein
MLRQTCDDADAGIGSIDASGQVHVAKNRPIVIDPSKGVVQASQDWLERRQKLQLASGPLRPPAPAPVSDVLGGVSLTKLLQKNQPDSGAPVELKVEGTQLKTVLTEGKLETSGKAHKVNVSPDMVEQLGSGGSAVVLASAGDNQGWLVTELKPDF